MNSTLEVLRAARNLISDPKHWTRGSFARDKEGRMVLPEDRRATQWCAAGAIYATTRDRATRGCAQNALRHALPAGGIWLNNDQDDGHERMLAAFDKAIVALEATQPAEGAPKITIGN